MKVILMLVIVVILGLFLYNLLPMQNVIDFVKNLAITFKDFVVGLF